MAVDSCPDSDRDTDSLDDFDSYTNQVTLRDNINSVVYSERRIDKRLLSMAKV